MTDDLISRADAMAYPLSWEHYDKEHGSRQFISGVESYREYIEHLPSAQPERGEWIDDEFVGQYRCSECDYYAIDEYDFCPNCGARMTANADQHAQRVEYVENDEISRCWICKHFERMYETPISSDGTYYSYVICNASECRYEPNEQTERSE